MLKYNYFQKGLFIQRIYLTNVTQKFFNFSLSCVETSDDSALPAESPELLEVSSQSALYECESDSSSEGTTESMSLYSWGRNSNGQLGLGDECREEWAPQAIPMSDVVSSIAAGDGHTLIATESGDVYACGRGNQGQLGLAVREHRNHPTLVTELSHESVVRVVASGVSSYAVTATGRVYQWGLVHRPQEKEGAVYEESKGKDDEKISSAPSHVFEEVTAGQLTGLADESSKNIVVPIDKEARANTSYAREEPYYANRQLKDIVTDSTERWMLANDDADAEYYRELQSMGYDKEELDEKMQNRGKEYHGMLRIQCKRRIIPVPELISSLSHLKIVSVAAGFAHCIALTDQGMMYSCGYNDRGQLGLGHRISSSEFKAVDYMQGKIVLQVECGQQHSMCRAIDRQQPGVASMLENVDDRMGAAVYVWGNGMLGQLGLGLKGTSKGRLLPTLLSTLCDIAPLGAIDISAGGNFSAAVAVDGAVYSWGHAEYNQHGSTMVGGNDYVDNHFYFVPRPVDITGKDGTQEKIARISCGSNFTLAITDEGDAYSWGWHAYGVLGHGRGFFGQSALKISSLGQSQIDRSVSRICAGSNHVVAITSSSGNAWAKTFQQLLLPANVTSSHGMTTLPASTYDRDTFSDAEIVDETTGTIFPCHQIILAARSPYFFGFLKIASRITKQALQSEGGDIEDYPKEQIILDCSAATVSTIQYMLQYIYTDTLSAPAHKRKQLAELADHVGLHRLATLCRHHGFFSDRPTDGADPIPPSSFEQDMLAIVSDDKFSDCKFLLHEMPDDECDVLMKSEPVLVTGHKVLLKKMPYFNSLFSGGYNDGLIDTDGIVMYDLVGFLCDGITVQTFEQLIKYAYSGTSSVLDADDSDELMSLLIASNRVGLTQLAQLCEKKLSLHLNDYPENIENCLSFAQMYNIPRLFRQCEDLLQLSTVSVH